MSSCFFAPVQLWVLFRSRNTDYMQEHAPIFASAATVLGLRLLVGMTAQWSSGKYKMLSQLQQLQFQA
jgi:hypothetical protein